MPLSQEDRITFSLRVVSSDAEVKGLDRAGEQLQKEVDKAQKLDDAHKNLSVPPTDLINQYQLEFNHIDGNIRSTFTEQDVVDSANKKLGNFFFPNNVQVSVPSLAGTNNIWTKLKPFGRAYAIGKNYSEAYGSGTSEQTLLAQALAFITAASAFSDIQNTTGQHCVNGGTCSNPTYTTESTCLLNGGTWDEEETIEAFSDVQTLKSNLVSKIQELRTHLLSEVAEVEAADPDSAKQAENDAAVDDINNVIIPALDVWLAYADFNTAHGQTTCAGFNGYNADLLAPTKLHSAQLSDLLQALTDRQTFLSTRVAQLTANLGDVAQDVSTGEYTATGLYGRRFDFLNLRLNALSGSATRLESLKQGASAQIAIKNNILEAKGIYLSFLPTSALMQSGSDTALIHLKNPSLFSVGDTIYIMAEGQQELLRAIKSISGNMVTLNDIVPTKYRIVDSVRVYKDLT